MRSGTTYNVWYEVAVPPTDVADGDTIAGVLQNFSGGTVTFGWEVRTGAAGGGTALDSGTLSGVPNNGMGSFQAGYSAIHAASTLYARVRQTTNAACDVRWLATRYGSTWHEHGMDHTHTTPAHTHPSHSHSVDTPSHTHTTPNHQHTIPDHSHALSYGIYESSMPATIRVYLDGTLITALNDQSIVSDFDLLPFVPKDSSGRVMEGWHALEFRSATSGATGSVRGTLFGRKFLSTGAA